MSYSSFLSDPAAVRDRGEWLSHLYLLDPSGTEELLRYAKDNQGRGMATGASAVVIAGTTIPAHTPFRKRVLKAPTVSQSLWQPGSMFSHSLPSFGEATLNNQDGGLDQYRPKTGYVWAGRRCQWFFGDYSDLANTIGVVFDGKLGNPAFSLGSVKVYLLGRESDFQVPTSRRVYRGTSYGLELSGDRTVSFGTPAAIDLTGDMTAEGWLWLNALPSGNATWWGWIGGSRVPWRIEIQSSGAFRYAVTHSGGTGVGNVTATLLSTLRWYHFAFVSSGSALTVYIWDEDAQTETVETFSLGAATRDADVGGTYAVRTGLGSTIVPWHDDFRVYNVARTADEIRANRHRPYSSGGVPAVCVHHLTFDDGAGTTVTDSSATGANGTISGAGVSTWLYVLEGGPELAGTPKPDVWGKRFGVKPVLVSPIHYVYQVAGGGSTQSITSYEGANPHTAAAGYASMRDLIITAPSAGNSKPYLARGYFRLGSSPTLPVAATVEGYNGGALGYVSTAGPVTRDIIARRGPKLADPGDLDTAAFTAYGTASSSLIGVALYAPNTQPEYILPVLDHVNAGSPGWWGYVGSSTLFHIEKFAGPDSTADYNLSTAIIHVDEVYPPPPIIYEVIVKYHKNDVVLSEDQVATAIKGTAGWQQWTLPWLEKRDSDDTLKSQYSNGGGQSLVIETPLYNDADAQTLATSLLSQIKGVREVLTVRLRAVGLEITIGMTVTLDFHYQDGTERFDLDGTQKYLVISTDVRWEEGEIVIVVWR